MASTVTTAQVRATIDLLVAVGDCIRSLGEVPSGELYAHLMVNPIITIDVYNRIIKSLEDARLITNKGHLIKWVGPAKRES